MLKKIKLIFSVFQTRSRERAGSPHPPTCEELAPAGLPVVRMFSQSPADWIVYQKFKRGEAFEIVRGFGRTREEAWQDFHQELAARRQDG